ncbi:MAG: hypothetical protein JWQ38_347 [Flavipsychrobacter sp.]|nr:hypothetical protein [Flavipsychrobacter sp.]
MEQQQFYTDLSIAKKRLSIIRPYIFDLSGTKSTARRKAFKNEVCRTLTVLCLSVDFFKKEGKKCEVDNLIILYTNIMRQLDSS